MATGLETPPGFQQNVLLWPGGGVVTGVASGIGSGGRHGPDYGRTPLVDKHIPEQPEKLRISNEDGEVTTVADVFEAVPHFAGFPPDAWTGRSRIVSHGWFME